MVRQRENPKCAAEENTRRIDLPLMLIRTLQSFPENEVRWIGN